MQDMRGCDNEQHSQELCFMSCKAGYKGLLL